eukprot:tig00020996_g16945.t1
MVQHRSYRRGAHIRKLVDRKLLRPEIQQIDQLRFWQCWRGATVRLYHDEFAVVVEGGPVTLIVAPAATKKAPAEKKAAAEKTNRARKHEEPEDENAAEAAVTGARLGTARAHLGTTRARPQSSGTAGARNGAPRAEKSSLFICWTVSLDGYEDDWAYAPVVQGAEITTLECEFDAEHADSKVLNSKKTPPSFKYFLCIRETVKSKSTYKQGHIFPKCDKHGDPPSGCLGVYGIKQLIQDTAKLAAAQKKAAAAK